MFECAATKVAFCAKLILKQAANCVIEQKTCVNCSNSILKECRCITKRLKFSLWCDFVEKSFLETEFVELIDKGIINAATSNPAIFKSAFLGSKAYADAKAALKGKAPKEIYEALAIDDIKLAASKLLASYEKGDDGFISIEVDPLLCDDAQATIEEGRRLFKAIGYPNVMIKNSC